ncbi:MAG: hypothetical protein WBB07_27775 [Mycobacterium sp.]
MTAEQLDEHREHKATFARVEKVLDHLRPKRMKVLVELLEAGSSLQLCAQRTGKPESTLRTILSDLNSRFDDELYFTPRGGGYKLTARGIHVAEVFRQILDMQEALLNQRHGLVVRYLPHHSATVLPAAANMRPDYTVELSVLGEHHRSIGHFISRALRPLVAGSYDVVIGIDLPDISGVADLKQSLRQQIVYTAWLEIMVPTRPLPGVDISAFVDGDYVDLHKLQASRTAVLTAPTDTRSRTYLDRAVNPNAELRVAMAEFESKVLIMGAYAGLGLPILPSDVALQFDYRRDSTGRETYRGPLAGAESVNWRWLPLVGGDGKRLSYNVAAHYRNEAQPEPMRDLFLRSLQDNVENVMTSAGRPEALTRAEDY